MKSPKKNLIMIVMFISIINIIGISSDVKVLQRFFNMVTRVTTEEKHETTTQSMKIQEAENKQPHKLIKPTKVKAISNSLNALIYKMTETYDDEILGKMQFIELDGYMQKVLNKHVVQDAEEDLKIIKDSKGYLYNTLTETMHTPTTQIKNLDKFYDLCENKHIDFLYVQAPNKVNDMQTNLPQGIVDYTNQITDDFIKGIAAHRIPCIDLRQLLTQKQMPWEKSFFITDHHWTFETAFWATQEIINEINTRYGYNLDKENKFTNLDNYEIYSGSFVGSQGKRVGQYYTATDHIRLYVPKFSTNLTLEILNEQKECMVNRSGAFYGTLINKEMFEDKSIYGEKYLSCLETNQETIIRNHDSDNEIKVLFIKDSYARPVAAYLSLNVKETRLIDLRQYSGSITEYIATYNPNIVIVLYNSTAVPDERLYSFN